jgi:hypothetical protein
VDEEADVVIAATRRWIHDVVIGLNLCPFARRVFDGGLIRYVFSTAADAEALSADLARELRLLAASPAAEVETTLLIHPRALTDFLDYNNYLGEAERLVAQLGYEGVFQIASFHPGYRFADADEGAVENYTNRSPYPMLHLLREDSISAVAAGDDPDALLQIPRRNVETLRKLGRRKVLEMLRAAAGNQPGERRE